MNAHQVWTSATPVIALLIPATLALAALILPRRAELAASTALALALFFTATAALSNSGHTAFGVRVDAVTCVMLLLVSMLGVIVTRYSRTCLGGEPGLARYLRWLLLTLSAVNALVIANNLLVVALGWAATSVALHQLLTFYRDRTSALVAAHKKFLVSRLADLCLLACLVLIYRNAGSLDIDRVGQWATSQAALTPSMQAAALLVVLAVALRSAQLPFHGWLIQVMEAPTPVSALLHAGIVNIGGFVLIRLAPLMARAELAQTVLVIIGLFSAVIGALVMTTRVSVKVALAWSTCAQMGFMLVQCGLGLWQLALLHLVAHSLYKAHSFLSAGAAVDGWRLQSLTKPSPLPSLVRLGLATLAAVGCAVLFMAILRSSMVAGGLADWALWLLLAVSLVPLFVRKAPGNGSLWATAARVGGVVLLYAAWHTAAARLMSEAPASSNVLAWVLAGAGLAGLFAVKATLQTRPQGWLARKLYPWLFSGLYLDECFTRLTFRLWPPRLKRASTSTHTLHAAGRLEARA